ncbi:MAG: helix-turn-helix transcriptional regulator, partial [Dehalococcoidia bacterium]
MTRENDGHGPNPIDYGLSPREIEVLSWVAAGMADKEIALRLRIRPKTVSKHLEHIRAKMKCIS